MPVRKLLQQSKLPKVGLFWSTWKVMVLPQWKESPVGATSSIHQRQTAAALLPCRKPPPSSPPPSLIVTIWYTNEHQREPEGDVELLHQLRVHVVVAHLRFEVCNKFLAKQNLNLLMYFTSICLTVSSIFLSSTFYLL